MADFKTDFLALLNAAVKETGVTLKRSAAEVAAYALQRATHLATAVGQPGFDEAVKAERDSVAMFAGVSATREASAADARVVGIIQGALAIGVGALTRGAV